MNLKKLLLILILANSLSFAQENAYSSDTAIEILKDAFGCIKYSTGNKHYMNEGNIALTPNGIFIVSENSDPIRIPQLFSDEDGCYIKLNDEFSENIIFGGNYRILNDCPYCGKPYWINCRNPNCPFNQAKEERKKQEREVKKEKGKQQD